MREFHGLSINSANGWKTRLKWHRLLRRFDGANFSGQTLAEGLALGASMEIDLRMRADGGFVLLHDPVLEGETTGHGAVIDSLPSDLWPLRMKDGGHALTLSEDLAEDLGTSHPEALLQFDMKDDFATIGTRGIRHLAEHFGAAGSKIIISAADPTLIVACGEALPGLMRGIDPTDSIAASWQADGLNAAEAELLSALTGPAEPDTIYLQWELLVKAAQAGFDMIALCHDHGRKVDAWTFNPVQPETGFSANDLNRLETLLRLRPDQITTDESPAMEKAWADHASAQAGQR